MVPLLALGLVGAALLSASVGAFPVAFADVVGVLLRRLGLGGSELPAEPVLWGIRIPRIALGVVVGASLGAAGTVCQGLFRNPLADPQLLGIGPGAALGAALGAAAGGTDAALAGGIIGGILGALGIRRIGRNVAEADPTRLVLVGVALGTVLGAWLGFVVFGSDSSRVPPVEFWLLGSLAGATWRVVAVAGVVAAGIVTTLTLSWRTLDLLVLGRRQARHLGVDTEFTTTMAMIATGAVVGAAVGAAGVIGFVGLLAPHLISPLTGPGMRHLVPAAALTGALILVLCDVPARTLLSPIEIPVGLVTAAIGGPFLLWLIARRGRGA